jgi:hypothetical protein
MIDPSRVLVWNFELGEMACLPAPALPNACKWVPDHVAVIYCVRTLYYWFKSCTAPHQRWRICLSAPKRGLLTQSTLGVATLMKGLESRSDVPKCLLIVAA